MSGEHYLVTARKYRPQRFDELVAQEHVAHTLKNAIRLNRLAHAYLFSGPRGVGKTTAARILAKAINCTAAEQDKEPCLQCAVCEDFEAQRSLGIFEIDAASNNKVEDVRELRETVLIPPQGASKKVYIIDEVHMLSNAAFNALLKTLEEPPPHVLFIFATTEPHKVLPTILSRCQRFDFRRISVSAIVDHLKKICEQERIVADEESLLLLARKGDGALRDALGAFDQAVALCGNSLTYSELATAMRVVDIDHYFECTRQVAARSSAGLLQLVGELMSSGHDIREFLTGLAEHVRNLLVTVTIGADALVDVSQLVQARYKEDSVQFNETVLIRLLMIIDQTQSTLATVASPRLTLELTLLKMARLGDGLELSAAVTQLRRIENMARRGQVGGPSFAAPPPQVRTGPASAPAPTRVPPAPQHDPGPSRIRSKPAKDPDSSHQRKVDAQVEKHFGPPTLSRRPSRPQPTVSQSAVQAPGPDAKGATLWESVLDRLAQSDASGSAFRSTTKVVEAVNNRLVIAADHDVTLHLVRGSRKLLCNILYELTGRQDWQLLFEQRSELFPPARQSPEDKLTALQKKHPTVQALVDLFDVVPAPNQ